MKRFCFSFLLYIVIAMCAACTVMDLKVTAPLTDEVLFSADGDVNFDVSTKATAVTSLSSFYASATTGSAGSETSVWNSQTFTSNGANPPVYSGGKWWPASDPSYHFYASNQALTFGASGTTVTATTDTDVICAYLATSTHKVKNALTFNHIFARLGDVQVSADTGYTISGVEVSITPKTGGTYNLRTGSWASTTNGSATNIANSTPGTKSNDIYLVPGSYTLTCKWTATKGNYSQSFTGKTVSVSLTAGNINKITATLGGSAESVTFGVSITAWGNQTVNAGTVPVS